MDTTLFLCSCFAIIPLAGIIGQATEELASHLGQGIGGLLNATFGNAAELIISLMALSKGLTTVVKASITGSIIGNLLLVLGMSVLAGGIKFPVQRFNKTAVLTSTASLTLAAIALLMPTVFHLTARATPTGWSAQTEQNLSLAIVGNAAEHSTAIFMAMKNKMDLSLGIAIGSSLQIALFVAPVLIFLSYFLGQQPMNLEFTIPEVIAVIVSVIVVGQISSDGESNWFEGVQLLAVYLILAILFFYLPAIG